MNKYICKSQSSTSPLLTETKIISSPQKINLPSNLKIMTLFSPLKEFFTKASSINSKSMDLEYRNGRPANPMKDPGLMGQQMEKGK